MIRRLICPGTSRMFGDSPRPCGRDLLPVLEKSGPFSVGRQVVRLRCPSCATLVEVRFTCQPQLVVARAEMEVVDDQT
jgi:hypothetical protein